MSNQMGFAPPPRQTLDRSFVETIQQLLGTDNALRNAAETRYDTAKRNEPVTVVASLVAVLQHSELEVAVREQSAVLLRQCCSKVKDTDSTWQKLGANQEDVKEKLLQLLEAEPATQVRKKVSDCIQSLGNQIINVEENQRPQNIQEWPTLMPSLFRIICDKSKDSSLRADCLWIVKELVLSVWQMLVANTTQSGQVLHTCLEDSADPVRAEAAALVTSLVDSIEKKEERKPFQPLIPEVSRVTAQLASSADAKHLNTVLLSFQATETADFYKQHIASHLMPVLCGIAKSHQDNSSRKYAFEVIITFMESKPKMMVKIPHYIEQALDLCMHFMMQLNDDVSTWMQEDDETGEDDEEAFTFGKEAVDRLSRCAAKVDAFLPMLEALKQAVAKLFQTGDWKQVVAGISTLTMIAEYVDDEATVAQMLQGIKMQLAATHAEKTRNINIGNILAQATDTNSHGWSKSGLLTRCLCIGSLSLLLQLGLEMTQEAFCAGAISAPLRSSIAMSAQEAAQSDPESELRQKLTQLLGRKPTNRDLIWRYEASIELPCLKNFSTSLEGQVKKSGSSLKDCKRKVSSAVLAALDFEKLSAETSNKKAKKAPGESKFQVGDEVEGTVTGRFEKGLVLRIDGIKAVLPVSEICDGFPADVPAKNSTMKVRVLQTNNTLKITCRDIGDRPSYEGLKVDRSITDKLAISEKVDAEVIGFDFQKAYLRVVSPSDPSKATIADLARKDFAEGAEKELRIGSKIQVRRKYAARTRRAVVSMRDPSRRPEDISVGDTLPGTVDSILRGPRPGIFLDVGVDRPAYMDWQECGDGHDRKAFEKLRVGRNTSVRVLKVDGERIYVTRRSGDLYRLTLDGGKLSRNTPELMSKFMSIGSDRDLDGEVFRLYPTHAVIAVKSPDGDVADGFLGRSDFSESFRQEAAPGLAVKVRTRPGQNVTGAHVMLTMLDAAVSGNEKQDDTEPADVVPETETESEPADSAEAAPSETPAIGHKAWCVQPVCYHYVIALRQFTFEDASCRDDTGVRHEVGRRVRYTAWGAIAQFSEDHTDVLNSEAWTSQLLPEFLKGLDDTCERVCLRCMEAFQHFGESVEREDLEPFVQPMMEKLGSKLQGNVKRQKKAITFIAVIAGQVDDAFAPYYGHLMPLLKQVIESTLHKTEERQLLGKCFECISLLARVCAPDVESVFILVLERAAYIHIYIYTCVSNVYTAYTYSNLYVYIFLFVWPEAWCTRGVAFTPNSPSQDAHSSVGPMWQHVERLRCAHKRQKIQAQQRE
ncbi:Ipo5 [Symbiodinium sp. CCMP2592]|nr:Ipo5 [Symbiodinium sp. CCMP2592]